MLIQETTSLYLLKMIFFISILILSALMPFGNQLSAEPPEVLTLVLKEGTEDDWELRSQNGKVLGIVKGRKQDTFKIYDGSEHYNGFVYQSGEWVPRDARQKRELQISSVEAGLYIDIITAAELDVPAARELKTTRKNDAENKWELQDQTGRIAGTLTKEDVNFKFYDESGKFMGYINTAGNWLPRLGINRREMKITSHQARFYLDVLKAVSGLE